MCEPRTEDPILELQAYHGDVGQYKLANEQVYDVQTAGCLAGEVVREYIYQASPAFVDR